MSPEVLTLVLSIGVPVLIAVLTPLVTFYTKALLAKLPSNQRALLTSVVQSAVAAAEQIAGPGASGEAKKQAALQLVDAEVKHLGINVPSSTINALLEASVLALNTAVAASQAPAAK